MTDIAQTERRTEALEAHAFRTGSDLAEIRRDMATKADIAELKAELKAEVAEVKADLGSAVNLLMGEIGKLKAGQEEQNKILSRIVAKLDGI